MHGCISIFCPYIHMSRIIYLFGTKTDDFSFKSNSSNHKIKYKQIGRAASSNNISYGPSCSYGPSRLNAFVTMG